MAAGFIKNSIDISSNDRLGNLHQRGSLELVLPVIRDFKSLRFLMTDKTVRKSVRTKTGDHSSVPLKTSYK